MSVSKRLRFEILKRDNHTCAYCGRAAPEVVLNVDHIVPAALGGSDHPSNLTAACRDCNSGKGSSQKEDRPVESPTLDALRWRRAVIEAGEVHRADQRREQQARDGFERRWKHPKPDGWGQTIDQFARLGLEPEDVEYIAERAVERTTGQVHAWRYFCKVAWSKINEARDAAARHLAQDDGVDEMTCDVCHGTVPPDIVDMYLHDETFAKSAETIGRKILGTHCSVTCSDAAPPVAWSPDMHPEPPRWPYCIECDERPASRPDNPAMEDGLCSTCRRIHYTGSA